MLRRYASVFQMLRGTMVVFAGLLTIVILRRALAPAPLDGHHSHPGRSRPCGASR